MPTAVKTKTAIEVPALRINKMQLTIEGDTQLVCHRFDEKAIQMILDKQMGKASGGRVNKVPSSDFLKAFYLMPGSVPVLDETDPEHVVAVGEFGFPAIGIKAAAVSAGIDAGMFKTTLRRAFHINAELLQIHSTSRPQMRMDMVRVGMGTADVRFRPEFTDWRIDIPIVYNEAIVSAEQILNLFNIAGFGVGIGEWRPEKNGQWGRFHVSGKVQVGG